MRTGGNKFVYHSLNDGNLYQHDAETNDSRVVMDESIFVRLARLLILKKVLLLLHLQKNRICLIETK